MKQIEERDQSLPDHEKLAPQIHVFNSFFYKQLSTRKTKNLDPYSLVEKWTKRVTSSRRSTSWCPSTSSASLVRLLDSYVRST